MKKKHPPTIAYHRGCPWRLPAFANSNIDTRSCVFYTFANTHSASPGVEFTDGVSGAGTKQPLPIR